jgi:hypothetical protein
MFNKIFNSNTGLKMESVGYTCEGRYYTGYVVRQGYLIFGIKGYKTLGTFLDELDAVKHMEIWIELQK